MRTSRTCTAASPEQNSVSEDRRDTSRTRQTMTDRFYDTSHPTVRISIALFSFCLLACRQNLECEASVLTVFNLSFVVKSFGV